MEINSILSRNPNLTHSDFVILYRTNAQSRVIEEAFMGSGISYRIVGGLRFYERKEIKDILAYLKLISNPKDEIALSRIINTPTRGIGKKTIEQLKIDRAIENPKIKKFFNLIDDFRERAKVMTPTELIDYLTVNTGYKKYILDGTQEGELRWENVEELKSVANRFEKLNEFLQDVSLITDIDNQDFNANSVTLMTLHNAKGLEFSAVFIVGLEEGLFPHARSLMEESEMEEERRLAYVGITRAKKWLYLTNAQTRMIFGSLQSNLPSRFLSEIPEHLLDKI